MVRKMLVVDDHPLVASALQALVRTLDPEVVWCSASGIGEALTLLSTESGIDLVLLDLTLDEAPGMQGLAALRAAAPELPVVVLSTHDDLPDVVAAVDLGAMGYISKRTGPEELQRALAIVMGGGVYIPAALMHGLQVAAARAARALADEADGASRVGEPPAGQGGFQGAHPVAPVPPAADVRLGAWSGGPASGESGSPHGLTPRQAEVLNLLLQGLSNKLIARELGLSVETVKDHVAAVLRALGVSSRTQAVLVVSRQGHGLPAAVATGASRLR
ncbi:MAG: hypothetical protein RLY78_3754 [Pseudomonadota bacterium]|jgi:DNA-binding NarL/FixJ family response regulator